MEEEFSFLFVGFFVDMINAVSVEGRGIVDNTVDFVAVEWTLFTIPTKTIPTTGLYPIRNNAYDKTSCIASSR